MQYVQNNYPNSMQQQDIMIPCSNGGIISLSTLQCANNIMTTVNEYKKNYYNSMDLHTQSQVQYSLSQSQIQNSPFRFDYLDIPSMDKELQEAMQALVSGTKTSDQVAIVLILTNILIASQGNLYVTLDPGHDEYPSIYAFFTNEPGTRKTSVMKRGLIPFEQFIDEAHGNSVSEDMKKIAKSCIKARARKEVTPIIDDLFDNFDIDKSKTLNQDIISLSSKVQDIQAVAIPQAQDLFVGSCTSSGLITSLANNNGHLAVVSAEGDIIHNLLKDKQLVGYFKNGYDFEKISRTTGRNKVEVDKPSLNLSLYVQPSELVKILNNADMQNQGFTARCVFLRCNEIEERCYPHTLNIYNNKILHVLKQFFCNSGRRKIYKVKTSHQAHVAIKEFEEIIKKKFTPWYPEKSIYTLRKLHGLAVRFALAYHIWITPNPTTKEIDLPSMNIGIHIAMNLLPEIFFVYHEYGYTAYPIAKKIVEYLLQVDVSHRHTLIQNGVEVRHIAKRIHLTMAEVEKGIGYLQKCNALRLYDNTSDKLKVILHPSFFQYYAPQSAPVENVLF